MNKGLKAKRAVFFIFYELHEDTYIHIRIRKKERCEKNLHFLPFLPCEASGHEKRTADIYRCPWDEMT